MLLTRENTTKNKTKLVKIFFSFESKMAHLKIFNFVGKFKHVFASSNVHNNNFLEWIIEAYAGSTMINNINFFCKKFTILMRDTQIF